MKLLLILLWARLNDANSWCDTILYPDPFHLQMDCTNITVYPDTVLRSEITENIETIVFHSSYVPTITANIFSNLVVVKSIFLSNSSIQLINETAFLHQNKLDCLYLDDNFIEQILPGTFKQLTLLRVLNLSKNKLHTLQEHSLDGLTSLEQLLLSHNLFTELSPDAFISVPGLRELNISHNLIDTIHDNAFNYTPHMYNLILNNNFLHHIPSSVFERLNGLGLLDISGNSLNHIDFNTLPISHWRLKVNASDNQITNTIGETAKIVELDLSNNNVTDIIIGKSIGRLLLRNNKLVEINESIFHNANHLTELDISNNIIMDIGEYSFNMLTELQKLNLSSNKLTSLPIGCFCNLTNLFELNLSHNLLENLKFGTFSGLNSLSKLYLNNNKLKVIHEKSFYVLRSLYLLYVNNNFIKKLDVSELIKVIPLMRTIHLNNNRWTCKCLFNMLNTLRSSNVKFLNGTDTKIENIYGIACNKHESEDSNITEIVQAPELLVESPYNELSNFFKMFNAAFTNSSFYQFFQSDFTNTVFSRYLQRSLRDSHFFKYFQGDLKKTHFFKHFAVTDKNNVKTESDKEKNSYYYENNDMLEKGYDELDEFTSSDIEKNESG